MTTQFLIGFYGWIFYIIICMVYNYVKIDIFKIKPRYFVSNTWRAYFGLVALILMTIQDGFDPATLRTWIPAIPPIMYIVCSFYLFFDAGLNALRGKEWDYKGDSSGWFDSFKYALYYVLKTVCAIGLTWALIVIL